MIWYVQISHFLKLNEFFRCNVTPAVNQIEFNPYLVDKDILDVCKEHGITVQAYSPIGCGANSTSDGGTKRGLNDHGKLNC